jgi:predicted metal-dependent HD superfamily phosphohydrolase
MLRLLGHFEEGAADYAALRFAAWFHDAVYDTRKNTNEEESAALAARALDELSAPPPTINLTRRLILATKSHEAKADVPDSGLFLDADPARAWPAFPGRPPSPSARRGLRPVE